MKFLRVINQSLLRSLLLSAASLGVLTVALVGHIPATNAMSGMQHDMGAMQTSGSPACKMLCGGMSIERLKQYLVAPEQEREPIPPVFAITASMLSAYVAIILVLYDSKRHRKIPIYQMNGVLRI